jgi:hypothetical protein
MAAFEKHLKSKNQSQEAVELELKMVKEIVRLLNARASLTPGRSL